MLVLPRARRQGVGQALLRAWLRWAATAHAATALLEVRVSNHTAIRLYEASGFQVDGVRKHYYQHPPEDALLMRRQLTSA